MPVGLNPDKLELDTRAGVRARELRNALNRVREFKYDLDGKTDADLVTLGYTLDEIATLRSAYADLAKLENIFRGGEALLVTQDFRTFARRIWGIGDE